MMLLWSRPATYTKSDTSHSFSIHFPLSFCKRPAPRGRLFVFIQTRRPGLLNKSTRLHGSAAGGARCISLYKPCFQRHVRRQKLVITKSRPDGRLFVITLFQPANKGVPVLLVQVFGDLETRGLEGALHLGLAAVYDAACDKHPVRGHEAWNIGGKGNDDV